VKQLTAAMEATQSMVNRNYIPGHNRAARQRHTLEQHAQPSVSYIVRHDD